MQEQEVYCQPPVYSGRRRGITIFENGFDLDAGRNIETKVIIGPGVFAEIPTCLRILDVPILRQLGGNARKEAFGSGDKIAIVTDSNVEQLYGPTLQQNLKAVGFESEIFSFPAGEQSKTRETADNLRDRLESSRLRRSDVIIALGGGVVGDLAGYVASTARRGIRLIQIPTSLQAMADSCMGGKTGVNTAHGKNLEGTFFDPWYVFVDPELLQTLPEAEYTTGLAEIIKLSATDKIFNDLLLRDLDKILNRDTEILRSLISASLLVKAYYVSADPEDEGIRHILNFGHTVGQALETAGNYELSHGQAIAIGMVYEGLWAVMQGQWQQSELDQLILILKRVGLPTTLPYGMDIDRIVEAATHDKKITGDKIEFWVPRKPSLVPLKLQLTEGYLRDLLAA